MKRQDTRALARLVALAAEAEQILKQGLSSHDIRHACAVARGYLDLARHYGEPVNLEDVERLLERMRSALALNQSGADKASDEDWLENGAT